MVIADYCQQPLRLGVWGVTEQKVHLSPAPSRNPYSAFGLFRTLAVHSQHVQPHFGWGAQMLRPRFTFMS